MQAASAHAFGMIAHRIRRNRKPILQGFGVLALGSAIVASLLVQQFTTHPTNTRNCHGHDAECESAVAKQYQNPN